jgi:hypothetical protein
MKTHTRGALLSGTGITRAASADIALSYVKGFEHELYQSAVWRRFFTDALRPAGECKAGLRTIRLPTIRKGRKGHMSQCPVWRAARHIW